MTTRVDPERVAESRLNDPPGDEFVFNFTFDLPNDNWTASITRKVNGNQDIVGNDMGSWNLYGAGTNIDLPGPNQPPAYAQADWYLYNAVDA